MVTVSPSAEARPAAAGLRVLIIGGGASGVLLGAHLLRSAKGQVAVTILDKGAMLGCGVAYSTADPQHLLNTRVANMSAYPDRPEHFLDWLQGTDKGAASPHGFVPRGTYGRYLQSLLDPWNDSSALSCWRAECLGLEVGANGVTAHLANGEQLEGDLAVLATGHALPDPAATPGLSQPWAAPAIPCDEDVLMVGSGLTMIDQVLSLLARGHKGRITAVSRRGLLPHVHRPTVPMVFDAEELPRPIRVATLMRWLRTRAREREAEGGDWRDVVDGLRPHLQAIWRNLPFPSRRSFLRHASSYWEVYRHRMPPTSHKRVQEAQEEGRLRILRGRFETVDVAADGGLLAHIVGPEGRRKTLPVARIVDCRGTRRDPEVHATALVAQLLATGLARIDPLRLGLDVAPDCAVLDKDGNSSGCLFALGPASRAAFWEITAIPDIRLQAAGLAEQILSQIAPADPAAEDAEDLANDETRVRASPKAPLPRDDQGHPTGEERSLDPARGSRGLLPMGRSLEWPAPPT